MSRTRTVVAAVAATLVAGGVAVTGAAAQDEPSSASSSQVITATRFARVAPLDPPSKNGHITLLEGPAFGRDGQLYFVDLTAAPGHTKVFKLDLRTKKTTPLYADRTSSLSSLQFSPKDGKIYLTGYTAGTIYRMNPDGSDFTTVFAGKVEGRTMTLDDIAFAPHGAMYVTDYAGTPFAPTGRVVRLDSNASHPTVLQTGLTAPNGISFTDDYSGLWVSELNSGREDLLSLAPDRKSVVNARIGMRANIGDAAFDSNAVDADGNVYQCVPLAGKVLVWSHDGDLLATIRVQQDLPRPQLVSTNLAIRPGTREGYITAGGENGGYIYRFRALADGTRQSNGG